MTIDGKNVGYTARTIVDQKPKYYHWHQSHYVFNTDYVKNSYKYCLVFEGNMDAILLNGVAVMTNTISPEQSIIINSLGKEVIVVPDQDEPGLELIDKALEYGYAVSFPKWEEGVKDANDAIIKYGKLFTLVSILNSVETSPAKIEIKKKIMSANV